MAPEYITERIFTDKSDVYSFGILFWEIMTRDTLPFKNIDNKAFLFGDEALMKKRPVIPDDIDTETTNLIKSCWEGDPGLRPSMGTVAREIEKLIQKEEGKSVSKKI
jgi:serine/threonine protein kinase